MEEINTKFDSDWKIFIVKDQNQLNFNRNNIQQNKTPDLKSQKKIEIKDVDFVGKSKSTGKKKSNPEDRP